MADPGIERRAARMTAVASVRQVLALPLGLVSAITIARLYAPADLGRFGILAFVVSVPALVGDFGLTQAFVRQKDDPAPGELSLASSLMLWIAVLAFPVIVFAAGAEVRGTRSWLPLVALLYLPTLLGAAALRANVLVQRRLDFARLAVLDLVQQVAYIAILATLGFLRTGVLGLVAATALTQAGRLVVLARWYPVRPSAVPRLGRLKDVIRSGLPLHLTGIVSGFHAGMVNWLGTPLFGPVGVGYLRWSLDMTTRVGIGLAHAIGQVVFPTVALIQDDAVRLGRVLARAVRYNALLIGFPLALLAGLATPVITAIFGGRWLPATLALQIFALHMTAGAVLIPLDAAIRVVRPALWSLGIILVYLAVEVALALALARPLGIVAIPVAHLTATVPLIVALRALLPAPARPAWLDNVVLPVLALAAAFAVSLWVAGRLAPWPALFAGCAAGAIVAAAAVYLLGRRTVWPELVRDLRHLAPAGSSG
ncbi:MAG TPA: oligosaccharide flippase family protein [Gemmatimonadales bacterium]|nr:oligosaccharide flippase family protein [Gemmatimonadales bacterium]